jgi:hypothetical protein
LVSGLRVPMKSFYADPAVRQRLIEYLGGDLLESATAVFVGHTDGCPFQRSELLPPEALQELLSENLDVARSLADRESLLLHLDVEYVNFDSPGEAFADPLRTFGLQEPVVEVIEELLLGWGIKPLHLVTGQGHHFVWRIRLGSAVATRIAALTPAPDLAEVCHGRPGEGPATDIDPRMESMFLAESLLMEYLAHRIKWEAAPRCALPVEITAVHVGPCASAKREMISIDISEYGDPLHTRMVRMPYTNYLKPWATGLAREMGMEGSLPRIRTIPLFEMNIRQAIKCREDEDAVLGLARRAGGSIPLEEEGTGRLLDSYMASPLRRFHQEFYSVGQGTGEVWERAYPAQPENLTPCGRVLFECPNDRLLKPAGMQLVTRMLLALGWHPRHIAGLIRSKFENPDYRWGVDWSEYAPATRADFYTRLFAGLWATGVDELVDFNCVSTREKGFCLSPLTGACSLAAYKETLINLKKTP